MTSCAACAAGAIAMAKVAAPAGQSTAVKHKQQGQQSSWMGSCSRQPGTAEDAAAWSHCCCLLHLSAELQQEYRVHSLKPAICCGAPYVDETNHSRPG
jgi:hypothetical protein